MTAGGLMQLVAFGAKDVELNSDPQITFFRVVYRRYRNFIGQSIENNFNGCLEETLSLFGGINEKMRAPESGGAQHVFSEDSFGGDNE